MVPAATLSLLLFSAAAAPAQLVSDAELATLSNLLTASMARHEQLDVVSTSDVREVVSLEGDRSHLSRLSVGR